MNNQDDTSARPHPRIWVVDDDLDDQLLMRSVFQSLTPAVEVLFLNNGLELVELLSQHPLLLPNVILLDLNMPLLGGFEALSWIRQRQPFQQLPVVILTTSSEVRDQHKARQLGANGFVTKPVSYEALVEISQHIVEHWA